MKLNIPRLFDTAKTLSTKAGTELSDFVNFSQTAFDQLIRAMRKGITFEDNLNCEVKEVELVHNEETVIASNKQPIHLIPTRVISSIDALNNLIWYMNDESKLVLKPEFKAGSDSKRKVTIILFYS